MIIVDVLVDVYVALVYNFFQVVLEQKLHTFVSSENDNDGE